jgi:NAD(P)-dependent dehydrogenase (short-subunit alcohol dehydrogenase family)
MASKKTVIVTGASQGIGAAVVQTLLDRGYNVVATSRSIPRPASRRRRVSRLLTKTLGQAATAEKVAQTAISKYPPILNN